MQLKSRDAILREAIEDWTARGLLPLDAAARLQDDLGPRRDGWGFQALVIVLGALCLGFAAMTFVAANWDEMTRLARVALIFAALWLAWGAAAFAAWRGARWWAEALALLGCGVYGAAIMLISQLYHIQGDASSAVFLWGAGSLLAAALLRAQLPLLLGLSLFVLWFLMRQPEDFGTENWILLAVVMASGVLSYWSRSRLCAHATMIALGAWAVVSYAQWAEQDGPLYVLFALALMSLIPGVLHSLGGPRWLRGLDGAALCYLLLLVSGFVFLFGFSSMEDPDDLTPGSPWGFAPALAALALALLAQLRPGPTLYDIRVAAAAVWVALLAFALFPSAWGGAAAVLALFIWITRRGWRLHLRALRIIGISGFVLFMLTIYLQTMGSLIDTAGFYLGAGVLLLGGAYVGGRLKPGAPS